MTSGYLSQIFSSFASKRITAVEVDPSASNGHEFNSSGRLRSILGTTSRKAKDDNGIPAKFVYLQDDEQPSEAEGMLSWYDSRAGQKHRSAEWRLYYTDNAVIGVEGRAQVSDTLVIAFSPGEATATVLIAERGSTAESQLLWLFGVSGESPEKFQTAAISDEQTVDMARANILEALGVVVPANDQTLLAKMLSLFGENFPTSKKFSDFIRKDRSEIRAEDDADSAILAWMAHEEFAFRVLERFLVERIIQKGFVGVDDFVACSLSVQNRRKSRAGLAFENHLSEVFKVHGLAFTRGAKLENKAKPDFLFPGLDQYFDPGFSVDLLTLLGAKTSCKDRWRQVLAEGKRFGQNQRHLVTLEPAISVNQLVEMRDNQLQLVVPRDLHDTYPLSEKAHLWDLGGFIASVRKKQEMAGLTSS